MQTSPRHGALNVLVAAWLQKNPGLRGVARGVSIYQVYAARTLPPAEAFKDMSWLSTPEKVE